MSTPGCGASSIKIDSISGRFKSLALYVPGTFSSRRVHSLYIKIQRRGRESPPSKSGRSPALGVGNPLLNAAAVCGRIASSVSNTADAVHLHCEVCHFGKKQLGNSLRTVIRYGEGAREDDTLADCFLPDIFWQTALKIPVVLQIKTLWYPCHFLLAGFLLPVFRW
jgi:hypothetical protein